MMLPYCSFPVTTFVYVFYLLFFKYFLQVLILTFEAFLLAVTSFLSPLNKKVTMNFSFSITINKTNCLCCLYSEWTCLLPAITVWDSCKKQMPAKPDGKKNNHNVEYKENYWTTASPEICRHQLTKRKISNKNRFLVIMLQQITAVCYIHK